MYIKSSTLFLSLNIPLSGVSSTKLSKIVLKNIVFLSIPNVTLFHVIQVVSSAPSPHSNRDRLKTLAFSVAER